MIVRMPSLLSSNPSESVQKRLYELLEQPQEPFLMEVYLLENGCSSRIIKSQSSSFCWPLNVAGKRLGKFGSHGDISAGRVTGFLKHMLAKLVYRKTVRKVLHFDRKTTVKKGSNFFDFFSVESKDQLSPVSVLELEHSDESSSPFDKQNECPLLSTMESSITSNETHAESLSRKKSKLSNRRKHMLDCLREMEERIQVIVREEWSQLKPDSMEIVLFIESAILDDLKEETIMCMLSSKTML